jgi:AcrR family transcriptional regulator
MPRAGLTPRRVVEEAEQMADEDGIAAVSLAALAARLGVRQPSLYKHVDGLSGLHRELAVRAKADLAGHLRATAVGRSGPEAVTAVCHAYRAWAHRHPGRYVATLRAPTPGDEQDQQVSQSAVQVVFDALSAYRLSPEGTVDATRMIRSGLHGFVSLEAAGGFGLPQSRDRSFETVVDSIVSALGQGCFSHADRHRPRGESVNGQRGESS